MAHKIIETQNSTIFQEYSNGIYFEIEFTNSSIKTRTTELSFNPIERAEDNLKYYQYQNRLNNKIKKHRL